MSADLSYVRGSTKPPLLDYTVGTAIRRAAELWPDEDALVSRHQGVRFTWAQLLGKAEALAKGLLARGLLPGDRVGIWAPNCAEWTITQFGTALAGLVLVNINPAYQQAEVEFTLKSVGVRALICAGRFKSSDYVSMIEALYSAIARSSSPARAEERQSGLELVVEIGGTGRPGWLAFDELLALGENLDTAQLSRGEGALGPRDPINIQFTSGTTGMPKGATLSHHNIINNAYFVGRAMGLREGDRLCIPVPLYHCFGMVMSNLACCIHGATMVYPSAGFDPLAVLEAVQAEGCTALHGVPTMFIAELEHPQLANFDLSTLRTGIMAGAICPIEVMRKVVGRMHMRDIGIAYGMTETSPVSFQTALTDPIERRVASVGRIQPHLEAKIIDPATGEITPRGVPGELCTRGYSVMLGYWGEPDKTAEAIRDGWMHTGDLAVMDHEGYAQIVGRIKDMIIRGGENIYPREIEEYLLRHESIEDVYVVGVPDEKFGEEICACIKLRDRELESNLDVAQFCRGQIAHYKVPKYVRFVASFPMTVSGKIQKYILREQSVASLGLAD